jgi:integrase
VGYDADKPKRKSVYGRTQAEVKSKLEAIKSRLADNTFTDTRLTVAAYLARWLEHVAPNLKPRTIADYRWLVSKYIAPAIGRGRLTDLKPLDIQTMVDNLARTAGARTANQCRTRLFSALKQAVRWELLARNPVDAVPTVKEVKRQQIIWTPDEAVRFLAVAQPHRLYALFYLVMATGLRRGEALALRWEDIQDSALVVRQSKTAKGVRRVTLAPDIVDVLERHRRLQEAEKADLLQAGFDWPDTGLVFRSEVGTPLIARNVTRLHYRLEALAGVRHATLHDLRHLNVSIRRKLGQDAKLIADQIGHTDPAFTTRLYTHLFEDDRQAAAVSLAEALSTPSHGKN